MGGEIMGDYGFGCDNNCAFIIFLILILLLLGGTGSGCNVK